ncbi:enoyl-CoA hydratase/isomerase [Luminiphilus syltensis NOR5-1B]|uniref:Enoyl-CoA hydratase/isomerase n=2 Tax=Luminiphilus TaxID=1341118 RepID=B8KWV9_9GAMM|nr:enoyl-CoA hydratase/isomerase [Luminiphilus syltensis NOR5-1B]
MAVSIDSCRVVTGILKSLVLGVRKSRASDAVDETRMTKTVIFEQNAGVASIILNNTEKHNSLGQVEISAIETALNTLPDDIRVVVLVSGGGPTFCGGASLKELSSGELSGDRFQAMTNHFAHLPIPTVAIINGNVFGGGFELAVSCDFRICASDITARIPAAELGLCYPIDGIRRITARLGINTARRLLVGAEQFGADDMKALGMVSEVAEPAAVVDTGMQIAERLSGLAPLSVRAMLEIIRQTEEDRFDPARAAELADICSGSNDLKEGLAAKRERRTAEFHGH